MKTITALLFLSFLLSSSVHAQDLKMGNDSLSYALGVLVGRNFKQAGYGPLNIDIFIAGLKASQKDETTIMSTAQCEQYVQEGTSKLQMKQFESNKIAGEQFLAQNKTKSGVISLENGLQYEVLKAGDGVKPKATDEVIVHYHGTLPDGTIFDSSVDRGETISFPLNRVISGWTEILQLMPVGSKWRVYIPYQMAYGDRPAGPKIQPYAALIFEIELFGIK